MGLGSHIVFGCIRLWLGGLVDDVVCCVRHINLHSHMVVGGGLMVVGSK